MITHFWGDPNQIQWESECIHLFKQSAQFYTLEHALVYQYATQINCDNCEYLPESQEEPYLMYLNAKKKLKEKEIAYNTWAVNKYSESLEEPFFMDLKYSAVWYEMKQFYTMKQKFFWWTVQKFELKRFESI